MSAFAVLICFSWCAGIVLSKRFNFSPSLGPVFSCSPSQLAVSQVTLAKAASPGLHSVPSTDEGQEHHACNDVKLKVPDILSLAQFCITAQSSFNYSCPCCGICPLARRGSQEETLWTERKKTSFPGKSTGRFYEVVARIF